MFLGLSPSHHEQQIKLAHGHLSVLSARPALLYLNSCCDQEIVIFVSSLKRFIIGNRIINDKHHILIGALVSRSRLDTIGKIANVTCLLLLWTDLRYGAYIVDSVYSLINATNFAIAVNDEHYLNNAIPHLIALVWPWVQENLFSPFYDKPSPDNICSCIGSNFLIMLLGEIMQSRVQL